MEGNLDAKVLKGRVSGFTVINGKDGKDGKDGAPGADGYTPVKGVDYFTEEDKQEVVDAVELEITEKVTAISITEAEDGTVTMVNTLESGGTETIVIAADANGNPASVTYNGKVKPIEWVVSE